MQKLGGIVMPFFVYILKCSNGTFYTGSTSSLHNRIYDHKMGVDPRAYTYRLRPVIIVWAEEFESRIDALNNKIIDEVIEYLLCSLENNPNT